jgi:hypothetical protein
MRKIEEPSGSCWRVVRGCPRGGATVLRPLQGRGVYAGPTGGVSRCAPSTSGYHLGCLRHGVLKTGAHAPEPPSSEAVSKRREGHSCPGRCRTSHDEASSWVLSSVACHSPEGVLGRATGPGLESPCLLLLMTLRGAGCQVSLNLMGGAGGAGGSVDVAEVMLSAGESGASRTHSTATSSPGVGGLGWLEARGACEIGGKPVSHYSRPFTSAAVPPP